MHKREQYEQLRQFTELEDAAKRRSAQSRSGLEDLQARLSFRNSTLRKTFVCRRAPQLRRTSMDRLLMLAQVFKSCAFSHQRCKLTRIRRRRFLRLPRNGFSRCPCQNRIVRFLVTRTLRYLDTGRTPPLRFSGLSKRNRSFNECIHFYTLAARHISLQPCLRCRTTLLRHRPSTLVCLLSATPSII